MNKKLLALTAVITLFVSGCTTVSISDKQETISKPSATPNVKQILDGFEPSTTNQIVLVKTNYGDFKIELFNETMPITAGNFEKLVSEKFYDGVIFHRVIAGFMIQGGDPDGNGTGGPGYNIPDEFTTDNSNDRGTLSMANAGPNTGGSQFFINVVDNNYLDSKHPVFGKVVSGMDIVDKISEVDTDGYDAPLKQIKIISAKIVKK